MPDWYRLLKAAEILGVPPWDLSEQPLIWQEWAISAARAEGFVREEKQKRASSKSKSKGTGTSRKR